MTKWGKNRRGVATIALGHVEAIEPMLRDFVLLPEMLTKKGENLIRLGRPWEAVTELHHAIELRPDYWPPYAVLSDHYKATGDQPKAREWLEKGLASSPNTKALQQRLAELGGTRGKSQADPQSAQQRTTPRPPKPKAEEAGAEPEQVRQSTTP